MFSFGGKKHSVLSHYIIKSMYETGFLSFIVGRNRYKMDQRGIRCVKKNLLLFFHDQMPSRNSLNDARC